MKEQKNVRIKKEYEQKVNMLWDIVTMSYEAVDFINEYHGSEKGQSEYGLLKLCDDVKRAKEIDSPTETDVKAMNGAIHGAAATLEAIVAEHKDVKKYLKSNWPQAEEIFSIKKATT